MTLPPRRSERLIAPEGAPGSKGGATQLPPGPQRQRDVLDALHEVVFQTDPAGNWVYLNAAWTDLSGYPVAESLGGSLFDIIHADDVDSTRAQFEAVLAGPQNHCFHDLRIITRSGRPRWVWLRSAMLFDSAGAYRGNVGTLLDIDARRRSEERLRRESALMERISADAPLEDVLVGISELLVENGATAARITAYREDTSLPPASGYCQRTSLSQSLGFGEDRGSSETDLACHHNDEIKSLVNGESLGHVESSATDSVPSEVRARTVQLARIAIERHHTLTAARHRAMHDPLTDLPNRRVVEERLAIALSANHQSRSHVALLLLDINDFRLVNDSFGHSMGDAILKLVATRLREALGPSETLGRLGGDEFVVIIPSVDDLGRVDDLAARLRRVVAWPLNVGHQQFHLEASVGIATSPEAGIRALDMLRRVDVAMYRAQHGHLGQARYDPRHDEIRIEGFGLAGDLRSAIRDEQLVLHYQPIVAVPDGAVRGVECLVRWHHPERGLLLPDQFIPLAETTGVIWPLTRWVLEEAVRTSRRLRGLDHDLSWSINLSARQLDEQLSPVLAAAQLAPDQRSRFEFELTETGVLANTTDTGRTMGRLRDNGYSFAIDDFGTGYASLNYLRALPVRTVKIDRTFVSGIDEDPRDHSIVRSAIELAHQLDIHVIAEGVESERIFDILSELSCDYVQGYHIGYPMAETDLVDWLTDHAASSSVA